MTFRLLGMPEELRLAIEQAGGEPTEEARLIYEASTKQTEQAIEYALREIQTVIGPHGSISRLQSGGIRITPGTGIGVFVGGVQKTEIQPNGTFVIGSDITQPATTTEIFFVEDTVYNSEQFGAGDFLIGDNTTAQSNIKFDASDGQLQFRYGTIVKAYMDTDGSLKAGAGGVGLDENGITLLNQSGLIRFRNVANTGNVARVLSQSDDYFWIIGDGTGKKIMITQLMGDGTSLARLTLSGDGFIVNSDTNDVDTVIYGQDNSTSVFMVDAGLDAVGIGGAAESGKKLKVTGDVNIRHKLPFNFYLSSIPMTVTGSIPFSASIDRTLTYVRWSQAWYVLTTNDGSNYWTITLKDVDGTVIKSFTTAAGAASTWTLNQATTFDVASSGTADIMLSVYCDKTGAPGALYLAGPNLEVTG